MKVKIYVNWEEREIVKEEELANIKKERVAYVLDNPCDKKNKSYCFLEDRDIRIEELFCMDETERENLIKEFENYIAECTDEDIKYEYEEITLEV